MGDDNTGGDDEDGVSFAALQGGANAGVTVTASRVGALNAWVDFNADGDWDDAGEQVFVDQAVSAGVNNLSVSVPSGASVGETFARFRVTGTPGYSYFGLAPDGEVEDYRVTIVAASSSAPQARRPVLGNLWAAVLVGRSGSTRVQSSTSEGTRSWVHHRHRSRIPGLPLGHP